MGWASSVTFSKVEKMEDDEVSGWIFNAVNEE